MEAKADPLPLSTTPNIRTRLSIRRHGIYVVIIIFLLYQTIDTVMMSTASSAAIKSIFLPYVEGFSSDETPQVRTTINGTEFNLPIDTGSTGLLMGAPLLPDISPTTGTPAHTYLSSSRILYSGRLVDISITFHGLNGIYAVATVPVLVVDTSIVCPWYDPLKDSFACPYNPDAPKPKPRDVSKITYMGVGFGRNNPGDGQPFGVPAMNPFLNIHSINENAVSLHAGYTISTGGVHLGLTKEIVWGYNFIPLKPGLTHEKDPRDWAMVGMCFRVNNRHAKCGQGLVDTGISQMYLRTEDNVDIPTITIPNPNPNGATEWVKRVNPGTSIAIGFPNLEEEIVMRYTFRVGQGGLMEPSYVAPGKPRGPPFVNTGRNLLFGYSVAFDAQAGRFGFRPVKHGAVPSF
ncbi:hypothetical protein B0J11DRAFT_345207 [Dendryphion nanum]|uniref:Uncharacterized protein n=1 Tax=Dendryphion nanum TaxID=256645 RepID=A0A9P9IKL1_9PLEO|nr:hypothetical protein B0J11DRAFT_345207 [Dendryphion nanum]